MPTPASRLLAAITLAFFLGSAAFAQNGFVPAWAKPQAALADAIMGAWTVTSVGGSPLAAGSPPITVRFLAGEYSIAQGTNVMEAGRYQLKESPQGAAIEFTIRSGENAGKFQFGLIELKGGELRWCMCEPGSNYQPSAFGNVPAGGQGIPQTIITAVLAEPKSTVNPPAPLAADPVNRDFLQSLQGAWEIKSVDGKPVPQGENMTMHYEGDHFRTVQRGAVASEGRFLIDATKRPVELDMLVAEDLDGSATRTQFALVEVEGDRLRLCLGLDEKGRSLQRPSRFATVKPEPGENGSVVLEAERQAAQPGTGTAQASQPDSGDLLASLQGQWRVAPTDGAAAAPARERGFTIEGDEFRMLDAGVVLFYGTCKVDTTRAPAWIDIQMMDRRQQPTGVSVLGLVECHAGTVRMALGDPNAPRPKSFASSKSSDGVETTLMVAHR